MIYGYCRVSTQKQKIERQIINIMQQFPDAEIFKESYTGTKMDGRKELDKLLHTVKPGDTIVFDEVSRMSRNAEEGFCLYQKLYNDGIDLIFLKEPHINTSTYKNTLQGSIPMTGTDVDFILQGINKYLMALAKEQIRLAFEQAQKEVDYLHKRTREGMRVAGAGKKISASRTGKKYETEKAKKAKEFILKKNKSFGGHLSNEETWELAKISKMTFYKYKNELMEEIKKE